VLCGDLNADPMSDEIRMLTGRAAVPVPGVVFHDAWEVAGRAEPGFTVCNSNPFMAANLDTSRRIEFVLVGHAKLGGVGHVLEARLFGNVPVEGIWGSDHLGVITELRY
jgi:endonuclease/exonuclease/phosphatase family metal-dependent hydrolase